jgi:uncharacterized protein (TIGR02145 family)
MKVNFSLYTTFLAGIVLVLLFSCTKDTTDQDNVKDPPVSTSAIIFNPDLAYGSMTDQCGNTYKTATIGTQTWMAENLRTTKYRNLKSIPKVDDDNAWSLLKNGAYCSYEKDSIYTPVYGRLYNWYAVSSSNNIAPTGWHVPSDTEWQTLISYLDPTANFSSEWGVVSNAAGSKLKETGTSHWFSPNLGATNETGFTALPGGYRDAYSGFELAGKASTWWTSSEGDYGSIYYELSKNNIVVYRGEYPFSSGYSVRLVKD